MEITETKLKTILKEQRKEFQTYVGALVEDFTTQVKLLAESISDLQRQLIVLREMVAKNTRDIEMMKLDIMALKLDVGAMKKDMEIVKTDIEIIKHSLKRKVDIEEFAALEKRVLALERNRT